MGGCIMAGSDHLTIRAYHEGKRPPHFRKSAKKHTLVTAVLATAAGVVWFVLGWAWALAPLAVALFFAVRSIVALRIAIRLEDMESTPVKIPSE
jgi:hypothetical protein